MASSPEREKDARRSAAQRVGDGLNASEDAAGPAGTSGVLHGMSGARLFWTAYAGTAVVIPLVDAVNTATILQDFARRGAPLPWWRPTINEFSSGIVTLLLFPLVWWMAARFPPKRQGWLWRLAAHIGASLAFAVLHVGGMTLLRAAAFALIGAPSGYGGFRELLYEYRKDLLIYGLGVVAIAFVREQWAARQVAPAQHKVVPPPPQPMFDIRDGARLVRTPVGEIAAVVSAGNYVEVKLTDGRSPLMRATLAAMEQRLSNYGFVRTHRSWLVNPARVRVIEPVGSGDHRLELEGGLEAPLSRRYAAALEALKRPT